MAKRSRMAWGSIRKLPSGNLQARYQQNDRTFTAPMTFAGPAARGDAQAWLAMQRADIMRGTWIDPDAPVAKKSLTFGEFSEEWLIHRQLSPRTREGYRIILDKFALPTLGDTPLDEITPADIRRWIKGLDTGESYRRRTFVVIKGVFNAAMMDDLISASPFRGVATPKLQAPREIRALTPVEIDKLADAMPDQYSAAVRLCAFAALRYGELAALERRDIDLKAGRIHVRRGVVRVRGEGMIVGEPKTRASIRTIALPLFLIPIMKAHLDQYVPDLPPTSLLFPGPHGGHLSATTWQRHFEAARTEADLPDVHTHDLRHTGLTLFTQAGASLIDVMARAGHTTASTAIRYQHATQERDQQLAERMGELALLP